MDTLMLANVVVHITNRAVAAHSMPQRRGEGAISSTSRLYAEGRGIAVSKDRPKLNAAIAQALTRLLASGEDSALPERYGVEAMNVAHPLPSN